MWLALLGLGSWTWDQDLSQVPEQAFLEPIPCGGIPGSSLTHGKGFGPTSTWYASLFGLLKGGLTPSEE